MLPSFWSIRNKFLHFNCFVTRILINRFLLIFRCYIEMAHKEIAPQDSQGSEEGRLYRCVASKQSLLHRRSCRSEGLPSSYRDEQEDLQNWPRHPHQGGKGNKNLRFVFCKKKNLFIYLGNCHLMEHYSLPVDSYAGLEKLLGQS